MVLGTGTGAKEGIGGVSTEPVYVSPDQMPLRN